MNRQLTVEIKGINSLNKGAMMMLLTILQEMHDCHIDRFVVTPTYGFPYKDRNRLGVHQKIWIQKGRWQFGYLLDKLIPKKFKAAYGMVGDSEIDVVLDASGFAYSDQWGKSHTLCTANSINKWKKQSTKLVLMPQAFGPFENKDVAEPMKKIIEYSELIYARDLASLHYLSELKKSNNVKLSPDFTCLLKPKEEIQSGLKIRPVALVPNIRMIDKNNRNSSCAYELFMSNLAEKLGPEKAFFLIHEGEEDYALACKINSMIRSHLPIVIHHDPLVLKKIICLCDAVVGARFHALVSALSQGVITIGCGWSHKYKALFDDYNVPECLLSLNDVSDDIQRVFDFLFNKSIRDEVSLKLEYGISNNKNLAHCMFNELKEKFFLIKK